jgi:mycothiol synthase
MANESQPSLRMRLASLAELPAPSVPSGLALRTATPDDLPALARLLSAAFPEVEWTEERTRERLFDDATVQKIFVVEAPDQALIATASARLDEKTHSGAGYLHWVGANPAHTGRGLGKLVTLAVLHEFIAMGFSQSVLETEDFRLPAIRLYKKLGFVPELAHPSHETRWAAISAGE